MILFFSIAIILLIATWVLRDTRCSSAAYLTALAWCTFLCIQVFLAAPVHTLLCIGGWVLVATALLVLPAFRACEVSKKIEASQGERSKNPL